MRMLRLAAWAALICFVSLLVEAHFAAFANTYPASNKHPKFCLVGAVENIFVLYAANREDRRGTVTHGPDISFRQRLR
jgi:hypothetical protein